jgi:hypothetical protein
MSAARLWWKGIVIASPAALYGANVTLESALTALIWRAAAVDERQHRHVSPFGSSGDRRGRKGPHHVLAANCPYASSAIVAQAHCPYYCLLLLMIPPLSLSACFSPHVYSHLPTSGRLPNNCNILGQCLHHCLKLLHLHPAHSESGQGQMTGTRFLAVCQHIMLVINAQVAV